SDQIRRELKERKRAEKALEESQSRLRALTNATQQSFVLVDKNGKILSFNHVAAKNTREVFGEEMQEGDIVDKFILEDEKIGFNYLFRQVLRGKNIDLEQVIHAKDGQEHWYAVSYNPAYEADGSILGLCMNATEITERKQIEKALQESHEDFQRYFNMNAIGMAVSSPDKGWIAVNDRLCQMFGYPPEDLKKLTWSDLTHPDDLDTNLQLFNQVIRGEREAYELEKRFIRKDGGIVDTSMYVSCVRNADKSVRYMLVSLMDITERKINQRLLEAANKQLQTQVKVIEELHAELREQAIRDPLTGLYNRRYLTETLGRELARTRREKSMLSIVMLDIDHFKKVNDNFGHQAGDQFLMRISKEISSRARSSDIICRYGGEEILLVLPGAND
ncbi:MAG TPA: diguanylate cyclase, partial [Pseudomonadales bacterium]|nr:diguanylate cyclase [Pseudomonadales bacterium]